jgi:leucyl aminopeptidase
VGFGSSPKVGDEFKPDGAKIGTAIATTCQEEKKSTKCAMIVPDSFHATLSTLTDISCAMYSTLYSDNRYRTGAKIKPAAPDLESVTLVGSRLGMMDGEKALENGRKLAKGIFMTKDIVNSPHNVLNSESLADTAQRIAKESNGRLKCTILAKEECEKRGMGAYLGVARGSETDPRFIHITYTPPKSSKVNKKVGIIGKGLLFDTGGYNIKTEMMELMKFDCGGSAAVLGAARATAELAPEGVEAHFIVAACEVSSLLEDFLLVRRCELDLILMLRVCRT